MTTRYLHLRRGEKLTVRFPATQAHIDHGTPMKCCSCPVALALKDIFPEMVPEVSYLEICLFEEAVTPHIPLLRATTTSEIDRFMSWVDAGEFVEPTRFELTLTAQQDGTVTYRGDL